MKSQRMGLDDQYRPFEVAAADGTVHKLRYYVENDRLHLAGTPKQAVLHRDPQGHYLDPEGLARLLAQEWLKEQSKRNR